MNEETYEVCTQWGRFRLDRASYQDYLDGRLWITSVSGNTNRQGTVSQSVNALSPNVTEAALRLRDLAAKQGLYATLCAKFPGTQVEIPYRARMKDKPIDELSLSVRSSNGLMRANAGTFGRLWELMARENGLRTVRNLGVKSEKEIKRCFFDACYQSLTPGEQAVYWQRIINSNQGKG